MLISSREACSLLAHVGVARRRGLEVLAAGFAGAPAWVGSHRMWHRDRVVELAERPLLRPTHLMEQFPAGVFLARRVTSIDAARDDQIASLNRWDDMSPWSLLDLKRAVERHGFVPFLATTHTFVALGADIVGVRCLGAPQLQLADPGRWFGVFAMSRVSGGPGRPWVFFAGYQDWPAQECDRTTQHRVRIGG